MGRRGGGRRGRQNPHQDQRLGPLKGIKAVGANHSAGQKHQRVRKMGHIGNNAACLGQAILRQPK